MKHDSQDDSEDSSANEDEFGTIGGIVTQRFGHMPNRDEEVEIGGYSFTVLNADSRRIHLLRMTETDS